MADVAALMHSSAQWDYTVSASLCNMQPCMFIHSMQMMLQKHCAGVTLQLYRMDKAAVMVYNGSAELLCRSASYTKNPISRELACRH